MQHTFDTNSVWSSDQINCPFGEWPSLSLMLWIFFLLFFLFDITCFFFKILLFSPLSLCGLQVYSHVSRPSLGHSPKGEKKKKLLRRCHSKYHCCGMLLTGAGQHNQKQNIINLKTESPALASSIIPRLTHTLISLHLQALQHQTFHCPCHNPPFHTPPHFVLAFRKCKPAGNACCFICKEVFLHPFGFTALVTHQTWYPCWMWYTVCPL